MLAYELPDVRSLTNCDAQFPNKDVRSLLANNHGRIRRVGADVLGDDAPTEHRIVNND